MVLALHPFHEINILSLRYQRIAPSGDESLGLINSVNLTVVARNGRLLSKARDRHDIEHGLQPDHVSSYKI